MPAGGFSKPVDGPLDTNYTYRVAPEKLVVPLSAGITVANVYDPQMYDILIEYITGLLKYMVADYIYSGQGTYDSSVQRGIVLVCPIKIYQNTKEDRLHRYYFYKSDKGQRIIRKRCAIERMLIESRIPLG